MHISLSFGKVMGSNPTYDRVELFSQICVESPGPALLSVLFEGFYLDSTWRESSF